MISTSVLLVATALKLYVPIITRYVMFQLPSIYAFSVSYLKPPYLYLVINCIIITIVASSKLQNKLDKDDKSPATDTVMESDANVSSELETVTGDPVAAEARSETTTGLFDYEENVAKAAIESLVPEVAFVQPRTTVPEMETKGSEVSKVGDDDVALMAPSKAVPARQDSMELLGSSEKPPVSETKGSEVSKVGDGDVALMTSSKAVPAWQDSMELLGSSEKPPVSARFVHRETLKASTEGGKALGVAKPKRQDTLESTWKEITEGRSVPLTRHLKKSDTWENRHTIVPPPPREKTMLKSDTFNDRSSHLQRAGSGKLKKEPSLSQEELNRRVEAFINKFNQEMKLQRQESLNQYQEMIKRGV